MNRDLAPASSEGGRVPGERRRRCRFPPVRAASECRDAACGDTPLRRWHNVRVPSGRVHNLINIAAFSVVSGAALTAARQHVVVITPAQALAFTLGFAVGTF